MSNNALATIEIDNGIVKCHSVDEALAYGRMLIQSGFVPSGFKTPEAVVTAIGFGREMGLKPHMALQSIAVVNGRPSLYGKAIPGVVLPSGLVEKFDERIEKEGSDDMTAICIVKRKGMEGERVERFAVADAKKAGLWGKAGPWMQYPKDMLKYKARARAFNALFADCLCGLAIFEDVQDTPRERDVRVAPATKDPLLETVAPTATETPAVQEAEFQEVAATSEEVIDQPEELEPTPTDDVPVGTIEEVDIRNGAKNGKAWTKFGVKIDGKFHGTFDSNIGNYAQANKGKRVKFQAEPNKKDSKYSDLISLQVV